MIDSHTHLDSCAPPNAELVAAAREAGITRILTVGMDEATNRAALKAAEEFPEVYAAVGRHPNAATGFDETAYEDLVELAKHPRCKAIGETGLDDYREYAPRADQERAFVAQMELAHEASKPLVIHTRAAEDDTIRMLKAHARGLDVILHCFSMPDRWEECAGQGWWFSFAGNVTYPKALDLAHAAARVPADRLLVETDAPYLSPQPVRKHKNRPDHVLHTARFVAQARGLEYDELDALVTANAATLFGW